MESFLILPDAVYKNCLNAGIQYVRHLQLGSSDVYNSWEGAHNPKDRQLYKLGMCYCWIAILGDIAYEIRAYN